MRTKMLEIKYCIECPHCNGFFFCTKIGRTVDEIPEDCPLVTMNDENKDSDRIDWLESQTRVSPTGISFDHAVSMDGEGGGFRYMRYHKLHNRKKNLRAAIDDAIINTPSHKEPKR